MNFLIGDKEPRLQSVVHPLKDARGPVDVKRRLLLLGVPCLGVAEGRKQPRDAKAVVPVQVCHADVPDLQHVYLGPGRQQPERVRILMGKARKRVSGVMSLGRAWQRRHNPPPSVPCKLPLGALSAVNEKDARLAHVQSNAADVPLPGRSSAGGPEPGDR